jgi:hypothetical protein
MVPVAVDHLLQCPSSLAELRAGAARAGQPHAALKVAEAVLVDHHAAMSNATGAIAKDRP